jgi:hypothetical protein
MPVIFVFGSSVQRYCAPSLRPSTIERQLGHARRLSGGNCNQYHVVFRVSSPWPVFASSISLTRRLTRVRRFPQLHTILVGVVRRIEQLEASVRHCAYGLICPSSLMEKVSKSELAEHHRFWRSK